MPTAVAQRWQACLEGELATAEDAPAVRCEFAAAVELLHIFPVLHYSGPMIDEPARGYLLPSCLAMCARTWSFWVLAVTSTTTGHSVQSSPAAATPHLCEKCTRHAHDRLVSAVRQTKRPHEQRPHLRVERGNQMPSTVLRTPGMRTSTTMIVSCVGQPVGQTRGKATAASCASGAGNGTCSSEARGMLPGALPRID